MLVNEILKIDYFEDEKTLNLFQETSSMKNNGFATKEQIIKILKWKSPRPLNYYKSNSEKEIIEITKLAFSVENEQLKFHILTALKGVNFPSASAILMFYDRENYPVLDIRVWQQLYNFGLVSENPKGQNFSLNQIEIFLKVIRNLSNNLSLDARNIEKRIFDFDKKIREGKLYKS